MYVQIWLQRKCYFYYTRPENKHMEHNMSTKYLQKKNISKHKKLDTSDIPKTPKKINFLLVVWQNIMCRLLSENEKKKWLLYSNKNFCKNIG